MTMEKKIIQQSRTSKWQALLSCFSIYTIFFLSIQIPHHRHHHHHHRFLLSRRFTRCALAICVVFLLSLTLNSNAKPHHAKVLCRSFSTHSFTDASSFQCQFLHIQSSQTLNHIIKIELFSLLLACHMQTLLCVLYVYLQK